MLIINVFFLLIALEAFAFPGHSSKSAPWSKCKLEKNGIFKLKNCLQICYKSELARKLATGTSKLGGRFRLGKRVNERPLSDCAEVVGRKEWHSLNITKKSDGNFAIESSLGFDGDAVFDIKDFGPIERDFQKALHLGAFMKDFGGMAFRILALDLHSSIGQDGTVLCRKTGQATKPAFMCLAGHNVFDIKECPPDEHYCFDFYCTQFGPGSDQRILARKGCIGGSSKCHKIPNMECECFIGAKDANMSNANIPRKAQTGYRFRITVTDHAQSQSTDLTNSDRASAVSKPMNGMIFLFVFHFGSV